VKITGEGIVGEIVDAQCVRIEDNMVIAKITGGA
jgi:hypothetical protein